MPSSQAISEFKALYQTRYGIALSDDDAFERATSLLRLYKTVLEPTMKMNQDYGQRNWKPWQFKTPMMLMG